jgi:crooked neck
VLGTAIGLCGKEKIFKGYVELELSLKEFDRARKLYERALEWDPSNSKSWIRFAELERNLFDIERARAIYDLAIRQSTESSGLDMPEVVWKAWIDFEFEEREWHNVQQLYERLLERTGHVKVWISFAQSWMAAAIAEEEDEDDDDDEEEDGNEEEEGGEEDVPKQKTLTEEQLVSRKAKRQEAVVKSRDTFDRAYRDLKMKGLKEERVVVLEAWKTFESNHGDEEGLQAVQAKMPRVVKKRRAAESGQGMEEYYDMLFPDDEDAKAKPSFALLQAAHAWRAKQAAAAAAEVPTQPAEEKEAVAPVENEDEMQVSEEEEDSTEG